MTQQFLHRLLQFLAAFLWISRSVQFDAPQACRFPRAVEENNVAVDYVQELHNLIDGPEYSEAKDYEARKCAIQSFVLIDTHFKNLGTQIDQIARNDQLKTAMREAGKLLIDVQKVARAFKALKIVGRQDDTEAAVRRACDKYSPKDRLHTLREISHRFPGLFQEIVEGTGYSETYFYQLAGGILVEAEMTALLAINCIKWIDPNVSLTLWHYERSEINQHLNETEAELTKAGDNLRQSFSEIVQQDMQKWLHYTTEKGLNTQQSVSYIYNQLAKQFSFMEWVVMQYDLLAMDDDAEHAHDPEQSSPTTWFHVSNEHYTVIAHTADKSKHRSWFGELVTGRTVEQLFNDSRKYSEFVSSDRNMKVSLLALKEQLIQLQLPAQYSMSIVKFRADLKVAHGSDQLRFHLFENVTLLHSNSYSKHVLIGW